MEELVEKSLDWAIRKLAAKEGFSLVGFCRNKANELCGVVIAANDDADMVAKAKAWLAKMDAKAFALIGEGSVPVQGQMIPVLILYAQGEGEPRVQPSLVPYTREPWEDGERIGIGEWIAQNPLPQSWLA